jgi:elongation factor Ts
VGNSAVLLEVVGGSDDSIVKLMNHCSIMRPLFLTKDDVKGVDLSANSEEFYQENCLMEQVIYGETTKVVDFITTNSIKIVNYVMLNVGDGVEKKEENLADEVSKMVGK